MHLHLFHLDQAADFIARLSVLGPSFDLFVSVCSDAALNAAAVLFSPLFRGSNRRLAIRCFPNRGRDVGAWVVGFGAELMAYDLVAHLHSKQSTHFDWGDAWRTYLLDNLISAEAFRDCVAHFRRDPELGVLFPPIYPKVLQLWGLSRLTQLEPADRLNCETLMRRMGIPGPLTKHTLLFSVGNMLWYRPAALAPLMQLGLRFEAFPEEPVPISGTLAHAIERLSVVIAGHCGYSARGYLRQSQLIERDAAAQLHSILPQAGSGRLTLRLKNVAAPMLALVFRLLPSGTARYRWASRAVRRLSLLRNHMTPRGHT